MPDTQHWEALLQQLRQLPQETEWVEFKENNAPPKDIGEYISALSNSAALAGETRAYLVWGVRDGDHALTGTRFQPSTAREGNELLEGWLTRLLEPQVHFQFHQLSIEGKTVVLLEIAPAQHWPVSFSGQAYIRIGSYKKPLRHHPERARALWRSFDQRPFEQGIAASDLTLPEALERLDTAAYFRLLGLPLSIDPGATADRLVQDQILLKRRSGSWDITNLGVILLAQDLRRFPTLRRKALRIVRYPAGDRISAEREVEIARGYACGFEEIVHQASLLLPSAEIIDAAFRSSTSPFPPLAVRELIANALIHQDFSITGAGPMIEIFSDRLEITNPGEPLIAPDRFLDTPPRSRNEDLASLMRRFRICEERGSGIDKVIHQIEQHRLPPPQFRLASGSTQATLHRKSFQQMDATERIQACYWHACLRYTNHQPVHNSSIRERFGIEKHNHAVASRILRLTVEAGWIIPRDPDAAPKMMEYLPYWTRLPYPTPAKPPQR